MTPYIFVYQARFYASRHCQGAHWVAIVSLDQHFQTNFLKEHVIIEDLSSEIEVFLRCCLKVLACGFDLLLL